MEIVFPGSVVVSPRGACAARCRYDGFVVIVERRVPSNTERQLLGGARSPSASYRGGRQMYQSRLGLLLLNLDSRNQSCYPEGAQGMVVIKRE